MKLLQHGHMTFFFAGRAWITEPKTGITLQAEITNTMDNPRPFLVLHSQRHLISRSWREYLAQLLVVS